jgi:hypothetical protein
MTMNTLKKTAVLTTVFLLVVSVGALAAKERYEEKFARTESLDRNGKVSLINVSGTIQVRSWDKAQVQIDAVKISEASSMDKARENAGKVVIEVVREGGILRIQTKYPEGRQPRNNGLSVHVNYVVTVPDQAALRVKNVSGDIDLASIGGVIDVEEVSGDVTIVNASQSVDCRSVSGTIDIRQAGGDVDLRTVSGDIRAEGIKGSIEAENVSGDIRLRDVRDAKSIRGKTISGGIECETDIQPGGRYYFDALSGGIILRLPASAGFEIEAETFSGSIRTDFPITMSGRISPKALHGTVGAGGATLRVKSFSGTVDIRKK